VFCRRAVRLIDPIFPFAHGLSADPHFLGKFGLGQAHVFAEGLDGLVIPDDAILTLLDGVLGLKSFKGNGLLGQVNGLGVIAGLDPGTCLEGTGAVAITPPGAFAVGRRRQRRFQDLFDLGKRQSYRGLIATLKMFEKGIVFTARFHRQVSSPGFIARFHGCCDRIL
jgi:hypothetical protein